MVSEINKDNQENVGGGHNSRGGSHKSCGGNHNYRRGSHYFCGGGQEGGEENLRDYLEGG